MTTRAAKILKLALESDNSNNYLKNAKSIVNKLPTLENEKSTGFDKHQEDKEDRLALLNNNDIDEAQITEFQHENDFNCASGTNEQRNELLNIEGMEIVFADESINNIFLSELMDCYNCAIVDNIPDTTTMEMIESEIVETAETNKNQEVAIGENGELGEPSTEEVPNWEPDIGKPNSEEKEKIFEKIF